MKPDIITPGSTRVLVRFWACEPDPINKPDQYELFPANSVHYASATIGAYNSHGCIVLCDANPTLAIPQGWQATIGWQDVVEVLG